MAEPIRAVWGVYNCARELVMLKPYDCTDNGWPEGYTVERLPLATPEMVSALGEAEQRVENLAQENARLSALVSEAGRVEMRSETGRWLLELKLSIDGSVLRLAQSPEEVFRAQVARCMDKFREWKRAEDAARAAGGAHEP